jgi:hypothetical protein
VRRRGKGNQVISDADWEVIRTYEATHRVEKEGDDAVLEQIRKHLNKISEANYVSQSTLISRSITEAEEEGNEELLGQIIGHVLRTASGNVFYAHLYARLVTDLASTFGERVSKPLEASLGGYHAQFDNVESCDPKQDYDRFCVLNAENERKRATGVFLTHLANTGVLDPDAVMGELRSIQKKMLLALDTEEGMVSAEQMADVCDVMVRAGLTTFRDAEGWEAVKDDIYDLAELKPKSRPGLSRKIVFKHMDIRDFIAKDPFA